MSILLDALRKTENSQRPQESPSIHSQSPGDSSRASSGLIVMLALLFVALLVISWLVWRQYAPPEGTYQPPVTLPAAAKAQVKKPPANPAKGTAKKAPSKGVRTPVESYKAADADNADNKPVVSASKKVDSSTLETPPPKPRKVNVQSDKKPTTKAKKIADERHRPADISYWELPDSVRGEIPEIKFTVLVYAAEPANRFVLINGQRLGEGDELEGGLLVREIRRDGVIFGYKRYLFIVER